jgi:hypothetical protein
MVGYQEFQKLVGAHACIGANVAPPLIGHTYLIRTKCNAFLQQKNRESKRLIKYVCQQNVPHILSENKDVKLVIRK